MNARTTDIVISAVIIVFSVFLLGQLKGIPREGFIFPSILLYSMIACSIIVFIRAWFKGSRTDKIPVFQDVPIEKWLIVVTIFILYVIGMFHLGFFSSTFLAALAITTALSTDRRAKVLLINAVFASVLTFAFYLFFSKLMMVRFPEALLF